MRILLTNDDGYQAPGLKALYDAVAALPGITIDVIAPRTVQSGKGHTISDRFRLWQEDLNGLGSVLVVDGSPPDCVRAAAAIPTLHHPDWVISGINRGSNLGVDIFNSGTVAAAREAAILGIPALAISYLVKGPAPDDWPRATREAAALIAAILTPHSPCPAQADPQIHAQALVVLSKKPVAAAPACWNVNLPRLPAGQPTPGVQITTISRDPPILNFQVQPAPDGGQLCENTASYHTRPATPGTDVAAAFSGWISMSPLDW